MVTELTPLKKPMSNLSFIQLSQVHRYSCSKSDMSNQWCIVGCILWVMIYRFFTYAMSVECLKVHGNGTDGQNWDKAFKVRKCTNIYTIVLYWPSYEHTYDIISHKIVHVNENLCKIIALVDFVHQHQSETSHFHHFAGIKVNISAKKHHICIK